jgi:glycosyltransferase involved in cell wall biosynthesis
MKKIAIIGSVGIPACYGGFETMAEQLAKRMQNNFEITVFCSSYAYDNKPPKFENINLEYINLSANGPSSMIYDALSMLKSLNHDVMICLGVSGSWILPIIKLFKFKVKIITNIDGVESRRERWSPFTRRVLRKLEEYALKHSDVVIADNEGISEYIYENYKVVSPVIEYGADHIDLRADDKGYGIKENSYWCGICRIVPENNIDLILEAFTETSETIYFIGNWLDSEYGKDIYAKYSTYSNINLLPPLYDDKNYKLFLRNNCKGFVHGHKAGGTSPVLVEAMYIGKLVATFDVNFNRYTTNGLAMYYSTKDELLEIINDRYETYSAPELRSFAKERYNWSRISSCYEEIVIKD